MKTVTKLFWCEKCALYVEPTHHDVTEKSDAFWAESTWEALIEVRCSLCSRLVEEVFACITCKVAEPESGADECTHCINISEAPVTNSSGAYLRFHANMERDNNMPSGTSIENLLTDGLEKIHLTAQATGEQMGRICAMFSTDTHEAVGRITAVNGRPVIRFHLELRAQGLDALLRPGSEAPLSFLAQRQAS